MTETVYKWIIVYEDGWAEEKCGASPYSFVEDLEEVPVAIIRNGVWKNL